MRHPTRKTLVRWSWRTLRTRGLVALAVALIGVPAAAAGGPPGHQRGGTNAIVAGGLLEAAQAAPDATFQVIVQGKHGKSSEAVAAKLAAADTRTRGKAKGLKKRFLSINGAAAEITGKELLRLADDEDVGVISRDEPVASTGFSNGKARWPDIVGISSFWNTQARAKERPPTIAVVDSGIDESRATVFGARLVKQVVLTSLIPNSPGDGRGHGTLVAALAAGSEQTWAGAAPTAKLVSLDVLDDTGMGLTSDVIAAADWILQNKDIYDIRVANFSLHASNPSSFMHDPLDKAVERLWFSGVVVVAAAGNYAVDGQPSGVLYAPGNDPFVITVGAADDNRTIGTDDDFAAPWSAYGYTLDGFAKPELAAPGRYIVDTVPVVSSLMREAPVDRIFQCCYLRMSGTSLAAPIVAGAAADLLARHPTWSPDQVKGALMLTAQQGAFAPLSAGVGQINAAAADGIASPPNPNLVLERFLVPDPDGGPFPVFDSASWNNAASSDASWNSASWNSASWNSASWNSASWNSASWNSASWNSASWNSASWNSASWNSSTWAALTWVW